MHSSLVNQIDHFLRANDNDKYKFEPKKTFYSASKFDII